MRRIREVAEGVASAHGLPSRCSVSAFGIGAIRQRRRSRPHARAHVFAGYGQIAVTVVDKPWMASEDVGLLMQRNPSAYLLVGSANHDRQPRLSATIIPALTLTNPCFHWSVGMMSALIADYLGTAG